MKNFTSLALKLIYKVSIFIFLFYSTCYAQDTSHEIIGKVIDHDTNYQTIPKIRLVLRRMSDKSFVSKVVSDSRGNYCFINVAPDKYFIIARKSRHYKKMIITGINTLTFPVFFCNFELVRRSNIFHKKHILYEI